MAIYRIGAHFQLVPYFSYCGKYKGHTDLSSVMFSRPFTFVLGLNRENTELRQTIHSTENIQDT